MRPICACRANVRAAAVILSSASASASGVARRFEVGCRIVVRIQTNRVSLPQVGDCRLGAVVASIVADPDRRVVVRVVIGLDASAVSLSDDEAVKLAARNQFAQLFADGIRGRSVGRGLGRLGRSRRGVLFRLLLCGSRGHLLGRGVRRLWPSAAAGALYPAQARMPWSDCRSAARCRPGWTRPVPRPAPWRPANGQIVNFSPRFLPRLSGAYAPINVRPSLTDSAHPVTFFPTAQREQASTVAILHERTFNELGALAGQAGGA